MPESAGGSISSTPLKPFDGRFHSILQKHHTEKKKKRHRHFGQQSFAIKLGSMSEIDDAGVPPESRGNVQPTVDECRTHTRAHTQTKKFMHERPDAFVIPEMGLKFAALIQ